MKKQIDQVKLFHEKFKVGNNSEPTLITPEETSLRCKLLYEELEEYEEAAMAGDLEGVLDALTDQLYIVFGTILRHGMQDIIEKAFNEVQASNMSKLGEDGEPLINGVNASDPSKPMFKILKGVHFKEPDLKSVLEKWL